MKTLTMIKMKKQPSFISFSNTTVDLNIIKTLSETFSKKMERNSLPVRALHRTQSKFYQIWK